MRIAYRLRLSLALLLALPLACAPQQRAAESAQRSAVSAVYPGTSWERISRPEEVG